MSQPPWLSPSRRLPPALSRLALLVALAVLVPATGHAGKGPVPQFQSAVFEQVDWLEAPSVPIRADSIWGMMKFAYKPVSKTWYLNGAVKLPGSNRSSWFLRNLPLPGERSPRLRRKAVFLDLRNLGLADGTDLKSVQAIFSLDTSPRKNPPPLTLASAVPVGKRDLLLDDALALGKVEPFNPGAPRPILITKVPKEEVQARITQPVQEKKGHGVAGGFARSLDWLNQTFKWDPSLSPQQIYEDLVRNGVSTARDTNGNGTSIDEWIEAKDDYSFLLSAGEIVTTVWDGADLFPPIAGIREEERDFASWLKAEMAKNADVELVISFSGGRYVFMLTGMFTEKGKTYVRFRFDDKPGDDFRGDEEEIVGEIFKGSDGNYRLVSNEWKIIGGFSDAVKP
jgi:hypothetical protein